MALLKIIIMAIVYMTGGICYIYPLPAADRTVSEHLLTVEVFFRENCSECKAVKEEIIPNIQKQFVDKCLFQWRDVNDQENYLLLSAYLEFFNISNNAPVYVVVGQKDILTGKSEIQADLYNKIIININSSKKSSFDYSKLKIALLEKRAQKFTFITVFIAGLIDGINPCIFATLIFFISILISTKISGSKMLAVGGVYCLACFLTYLLLGFGIFNFLNLLSEYSLIRQLLEWGTVIVLFLFSIISFADAFRFKKTQKTEIIFLQLPGKLKKYIHNIMRNRLKTSYLLGGVFITGILVTIIESACTGQVYIPTLVLLTKENGIGIWFFYLLIYNIAFIIPLFTIFVVAWRGASIMFFLTWSKKHVIYSKIILGIFFLLMAFLLFLIL